MVMVQSQKGFRLLNCYAWPVVLLEKFQEKNGWPNKTDFLGSQEATHIADVESVRFLLLQEGILINKSSREYIRREGAADVICWRTPLYRAEKLVASAATNGSLLLDNENSDEDDEVEQLSKRNKVAELLRDAGGLI